MMKRAAILLMPLSLALLSGCGAMPDFLKSKPGGTEQGAAEPLAAPPGPGLSAPPPPVGSASAEVLDTTTPEQREAAFAAPAPAADAALGTVVVALGKVTEPGFWLRSSLVAAATPGTVKTASGATVQVDLLPGQGAAQLSLAAFRALGLSLTDLPAVTVFIR